MKPRQTGCARRWAKLSTSCVQISHPRTLCRKPRRASVCQNSRGGARSISRARAIRARLPSPGLASRCGFWRRLKRNKEGVHEVTLPLRDSSSSLVDTATRVFRERAATKQREFIGAAQTHVAKGAAMLDQTSVHDAPLFKLKGGGPHFLDSQGSCWTAAYIQEGGNVVRDLRANISAEAGARQTYESLIKACDDEGTKKTLHHLLTREITHANMFMKALDQMGKLDDPFFGNIPPDETVKLVFNLSQDEDVRGPWNEEPDFEYVADPRPEGGLPAPPINADDEGHDSRSPKPRKKRVGTATTPAA